MWEINSFDVFALRTPGGDEFAEFVNSLIYADAYLCGVSQAEIFTTLRTNVRDGGVDAEIRTVIPSDSGWMSYPTIWQYKATGTSNISPGDLRNEIINPSKGHTRNLIEQGYAYRFCICDDVTSEKTHEWEAVLFEEIQKINQQAPAPKVINASHLAEWANCFPAILIRFFRQELLSIQDLKTWGQNIKALTPDFVQINDWETVKNSIIQHIDLSTICHDVVLLLQGEAGVGKTRLTYESIASIPNIASLVMYAIDKQAINIAYPLARDDNAKGILIADECLPNTRRELENILQGHSDRVRVICLDNSGEPVSSAQPEFWLRRISDNDLEKILDHNFPLIPLDRRRVYVELSGGFIRLAASLCKDDSLIISRGSLDPSISSIGSYLQTTLSNDQRKVAEVISLFRRLGIRGEVKNELDTLCRILNLDRNDFLATASTLKDVPGFIAFAGRYIYVTPEIVAQTLFRIAWRRIIEPDPETFLNSLSSVLLQSFQERIAKSADEEVRRIVGDFFRNWAARLTPNDLATPEIVNQLVILIDTEPDTFLTILFNLVTQASREQLLATNSGYTGTRRSLVWLAERMVCLPELFDLSEFILWKLALTETEGAISNNATGVWCQLFNIFLSGTSTPFIKRIEKLKERLFSDEEEEIKLALKGFDRALSLDASRISGPPIVAGRIPPEEWKPSNQEEVEACFGATLDILLEATTTDSESLRAKTYNTVLRNLRSILQVGSLEKIQSIFQTDRLPNHILFSLIGEIEDFLHYNKPQESNALGFDDVESVEVDDASSEAEMSYWQKIEEWLVSLRPDDFSGKLRSVVGKSPWHFSFRDDQEMWNEEVKSLANSLYQDKNLLSSVLEWLCSDQAMSANALGKALGELDAEGSCFELILDSTLRNNSTAFARGYIWGNISIHPDNISEINEKIDAIENDSPVLALDLFLAGGETTNAVERALRLFDSKRLSLAYSDRFANGLIQRPLNSKEFLEILRRLVSSVRIEAERWTVKAALDLVAFRASAQSQVTSEKSSIFDSSEVQELIFELLVETANSIFGESYHWNRSLEMASEFDAKRAIETAALALASENQQQRMGAEKFLVNSLDSFPNEVMKVVGNFLLNPGKTYLVVEKYRFLIRSMPIELMKSWLQSVGVEGAQKIARSLPIPYLSDSGKPVVPPLTEFVLTEFEEDERTFRNFCMGSHSLQLYSGDIPTIHEKEGDVAKHFLTHSIRRIREWANYEITSSRQSAQYWRQLDEEDRIK
jgi:hypothetical protein